MLPRNGSQQPHLWSQGSLHGSVPVFAPSGRLEGWETITFVPRSDNTKLISSAAVFFQILCLLGHTDEILEFSKHASSVTSGGLVEEVLQKCQSISDWPPEQSNELHPQQNPLPFEC